MKIISILPPKIKYINVKMSYMFLHVPNDEM